MDIKGVLTKKYADLPLWMWGVVAIGGVGVGLYFYKQRQVNSATTTSTASTSVPSTTAQQTAGYGDYQPAGSNAGSQSPTGATINIGVPATPSNWLTTLILTSNGPINLYASAGTPGGTPDAVIGTIPSGATVQATGPEVVGAWITPNSSELWYPVTYNGTPGFVSAINVANASTGINNAPVVPPPITNPQPPTNNVGSATVRISGYLATTPGGVNNKGSNLATLNPGDVVYLLSNTTQSFGPNKYYNVWSNGQSGYVKAQTIGK